MRPRFRLPGPIVLAFVTAALGSWPADVDVRALQSPPAPQAAQAAPAPAQGTSPGEKPVNVQVLKDLSGAQLHDAMVFMAASLGTNCGFCHVRTPQGEWAFDKDDKPEKKTARRMLQMTRGLNAEYFEGRPTVTCSSCHQARHQPNPAPPLARPSASGQAEAMPGPPRGEERGARPSAPAETPDQVVAKYVQALGGEERLRAVRSAVMRGTATNRAGEASPILVEEAVPDRYRSSVDAKPPSTRAYDGASAWMQVGGNVRTIEGVQQLYASRLGDLGLALQLKDKFAGLAAARYDRIEGHDVIWLNGRPAAGVMEMLAFDRASGLLIRRMVRLQTPMGRLALEIDYADYRDVDGVKIPFEVRLTDWENILTKKFSEVKLNAPIDESRFKLPESK